MDIGIEFEWKLAKAAKNLRKHKVTFQEAATVFADETSATVYDLSILMMKIDC